MNKKSFPSFKSAPKDKAEKKVEEQLVIKPKSSTCASLPERPSKRPLPASSDIFSAPLLFTVEPKISEPIQPRLEEQFVTETTKARQSSFTRKLRQDPANVDLWLEFVHFQDCINSFEKLSKRKQVERKLSILEKALEHNPLSLLLIEAHLKLLSEVDSFAELLKNWDIHMRLLKSRDTHSYWELALKYLEFRTSYFSCFNRDEIMSIFAAFFKESSKTSVKLELLRLLFGFLFKTGHYEFLIALVQAIIELNIDLLNYGTIEFDSYADQWDSGLCDRIGSYEEAFCTIPKGHDFELFQKWFSVEEERSKNQILPVIDDEVEDLDRNILFDDISVFVVTFDSGQIEKSLKAVIKCFTSTVRLSHSFEIIEANRFVNHDLNSPFLHFTTLSLKVLLPYFEHDWEVICTYMLLSYAESHNIDAIKGFLASNRHSAVHFVAFGVFCMLTGDFEQSKKVLLTIAEKDVEFDKDVVISVLAAVFQKLGCYVTCANVIYFKSKPWSEFVSWIRRRDLNTPLSNIAISNDIIAIVDFSSTSLSQNLDVCDHNEDSFRKEVYNILQSNVGDKSLYSKLIAKCAAKYESISREIYCLMIEQQLRVRCLLEELPFV